jgi:hypothetical protein
VLLSPEMIIAIAAILVTCIVTLGSCIAVLWRQQVGANKRCESDGARRDKKVEELDKFQRNELIQMRAESTSLAASAVSTLDRARRAIERAERRHPSTGDDTPFVNAMTKEGKH